MAESLFDARRLLKAAAIFLISVGCGSESPHDMRQRAISDPTLSDSEAIELIANATFEGVGVSTAIGGDGEIQATISAHGVDDSKMPPSMLKTAEGGINNAMKKIQLMMFIRHLVTFVQAAKNRNLGSVMLTLQTPTSSIEQELEWIDTYRSKLGSDKFEDFLKAVQVSGGDQPAAAEELWEVELDRFNDFTYE